MALELEGTRVLCLATDGVEEVELSQPALALEGFGATVVLAAPHMGPIQGFRHVDKGRSFEVDRLIADVDPAEFDALFLPGGVINADALRTDREAVRVVRSFFDADKPVAVICHGAWILLDANVIAGQTLTSWPSLRTDIRNAGGRWVDETAHLDGKLLSSRKPADLPVFIEKMVELFAELPERGQARERWRRGRSRDEVDQASRESFPASDSPTHW